MCIIPAYAALTRCFADLITPTNSDPCKRNALTLYLSFWEFDEDWYMRRYPDLREAVSSRQFASGWHHFAAVGYFEGRLPVEPIIDGDWYMTRYSDVATAILDGSVGSARQHYFDAGRTEGRLPSKPRIDPSWYADRFLPFDGRTGSDEASCTDHFVRVGYLNGAAPRSVPC